MRQMQLAKIQSWKMSGALSIAQVDQQSEIVNYTWEQINPERYRIKIMSALNLYTVIITRQFHVITLSKNGTTVFNAKTPEKLMKKALGWSLPIQPLQNWIKGMPVNGDYTAKYDQYGHIILLQQMGWVIKYDAYKTNGNFDLPQQIILRRSGIQVKIIIRLTEQQK